RLGESMRARKIGALRLLVEFQLDGPLGSGLRESLTLRMARPTNSPRELFELAILKAERLRLRRPVRGIIAKVGSAVPIEQQQRSLFEVSQSDSPHALAMFINRIANRVGAERICRVEKRRSIDPQHAYALMPAVDAAPSEFRMTPAERERARRLPLMLFGDAGEAVGVETDELGTPRQVTLRNVHQVIRCWGPERVETGWWRRRGRRRDAYWVELDNGSRLWLWFDLRSRQWCLAGEYA
ncbi:MAG: hypothetical protein AAF266_04075, partial [Planctomycetota bacterium]